MVGSKSIATSSLCRRPCRECGSTFKPRLARQSHCSRGCASKRTRRVERKRKRPYYVSQFHDGERGRDEIRLANYTAALTPETIKVVLCPTCGDFFKPRDERQKFCSKRCFGRYQREMELAKRPLLIGEINPDLAPCTIGAVGELLVAADLLRQGWAVFRAVSPACFCDLVAYRKGILRFIEVRSGGRRSDAYDTLVFNRKLSKYGRPTEFAVILPAGNEIIYVPIAGEGEEVVLASESL
jgi:hypothetical protein